MNDAGFRHLRLGGEELEGELGTTLRPPILAGPARAGRHHARRQSSVVGQIAGRDRSCIGGGPAAPAVRLGFHTGGSHDDLSAEHRAGHDATRFAAFGRF